MIERVRTFSENAVQHTNLGLLCTSSVALLLDLPRMQSAAVVVRRAGTLELLATCGEAFSIDLAASPLVAKALDQTEAITHVCETGQDNTMTLVPMRIQDHGIGVVVVCSDSSYSRTDPSLDELLISLSQIFGLAIQHCLILQDLDQLAALDPLSGLMNHRLGMQRLNEEVSRAKRSRGRVGLMIIDLDYFSAVNDNYGTVVGDQLLAAISCNLQEVVRGDDVLAHVSGGTFMVVTTNSAAPDVVRVADRVRRQVATSVIAAKTEHGVSPVSVTASVGCASFPDHPAQDGEELFQAAMEALEFAKDTGRDQLMVAGRLNVVALSPRTTKGPGNSAG